MVRKIHSEPILQKLVNLIFLLLFINVNLHANEAEILDLTEVKIAVTDIPTSLSPYTPQGLDPQYSHLFFDPLVRWGQNNKLEYRLIESVETINENKIRFKLKKNIYFHSGNILTTNDVIWSFKEATDNKYLHRKIQHSAKFTDLEPYQFDIETELSQDQLLDYLTHLFILDSDFYKTHKVINDSSKIELSSQSNKRLLSGTGPYQIESFYAGVNLRVKINKSYWQSLPSLPLLNFVKIRSKESRLYALLAGDVDISEAIDNEQIESINMLGDKTIHQTSAINALFLMMNEQNNELLKIARVRNAIHLAINQAGILKHILNGTGSISKSLNGQIKNREPSNEIMPVYDYERSKLLLKETRVPANLSLLVMEDKNAHTKEIVTALKNMLQKVGIRLVITRVINDIEWNEEQFQHDLLLTNWESTLVEEENLFQDIFFNSRLSPYIRYLFEKQKQTLSSERQVEFFNKYQEINYIVPLVTQNKLWASDKKFDLNSVFSINGIPYWHLLNAVSN